MGLFDLFKKSQTTEQDRQEVRGNIHHLLDWEDFYYELNSQIEERKECIWSTVNRNKGNPDEVVESYKKALAKYDEFVEWCISKDERLGREYIEAEGHQIKDELQKEYDDYMKHEYADASEAYNQYLSNADKREAVKKKLEVVKELKPVLVEHIKASGPIKQVDLKKLLSDEEVTYYGQAIYELVQEGKVDKSKEGSKVVYSIGE